MENKSKTGCRQQIAAAATEGSQSVLTHRPQFRLTGTCLLGGNNEAVLHIHSPRSSPRQTGELGLSAWLATSPPPFVSKWFNVSFVLNHIRRPRPTPSHGGETSL
ncbi:uncharacterized protein AB9X84_006597 [Acanthopagrus schlegelii]